MQYIDPSSVHPALPDLIGKLAAAGAERVILFGSRARGDYTERADIDLCIDAEDMDSLQWDRVIQEVARAQTLLKIDAVYLPKLGTAMKDSILREGKVLYAKQ